MKTLKYSILIPAFFFNSVACLSAGSLVTGQSISFTSEELSGGSATAYWSINSANSTSDTDLWDLGGVTLGSSGNRLYMSSATNSVGYATWLVTVPEGFTITEFSWGALELLLDGAKNSTGDDSLVIQYSTDGTNWNVLADYPDLGTGTATETLSDLDYTQSMSSTTNELYIQIAHVEGTAIANDSGYWALISSTAANGGTNAASFITVDVAAIPEPASTVLILSFGIFVGVVAFRRFRHLQPTVED